MSAEEANAHCNDWFNRHIRVMIEREQASPVRNKDGSLKSHEELTRLAVAAQWDQIVCWLEHHLGRTALEWRKELAIFPENLTRMQQEAHLVLTHQHRHARFYVYQFEFVPYVATDPLPCRSPAEQDKWWLGHFIGASAAAATGLAVMNQCSQFILFRERETELNVREDLVQIICPAFRCQINADGVIESLHGVCGPSRITGTPEEIASRLCDLLR